MQDTSYSSPYGAYLDILAEDLFFNANGENKPTAGIIQGFIRRKVENKAGLGDEGISETRNGEESPLSFHGPQNAHFDNGVCHPFEFDQGNELLSRQVEKCRRLERKAEGFKDVTTQGGKASKLSSHNRPAKHEVAISNKKEASSINTFNERLDTSSLLQQPPSNGLFIKASQPNTNAPSRENPYRPRMVNKADSYASSVRCNPQSSQHLVFNKKGTRDWDNKPDIGGEQSNPLNKVPEKGLLNIGAQSNKNGINGQGSLIPFPMSFEHYDNQISLSSPDGKKHIWTAATLRMMEENGGKVPEGQVGHGETKCYTRMSNVRLLEGINPTAEIHADHKQAGVPTQIKDLSKDHPTFADGNFERGAEVISRHAFYADIRYYLAKKSDESSLKHTNNHPDLSSVDRQLEDMQRALVRKTKNNIKAIKKGNVFDHLSEWRNVDLRDSSVSIEVYDREAIRNMKKASIDCL